MVGSWRQRVLSYLQNTGSINNINKSIFYIAGSLFILLFEFYYVQPVKHIKVDSTIMPLLKIIAVTYFNILHLPL